VSPRYVGDALLALEHRRLMAEAERDRLQLLRALLRERDGLALVEVERDRRRLLRALEAGPKPKPRRPKGNP
jgi:hypothetical protein